MPAPRLATASATAFGDSSAAKPSMAKRNECRGLNPEPLLPRFSQSTLGARGRPMSTVTEFWRTVLLVAILLKLLPERVSLTGGRRG